MFQRPVWAEVNLPAISQNLRRVKALLKPGTAFCAVVKADAYGHGAPAVARTALEAGADRLAVAILGEALELRRSGFDSPILILGYTPPEQASLVVAHGLTQTVFSIEDARALSAAARSAGTKAKVHIKIDTGMSRIGIKPEDAGQFAEALGAMPGLEIEGVFSHFASADSGDKTFAQEQYNNFLQAVDRIKAGGIEIKIRHMANSAATVDMPETHLDMVRAGIVLYGHWPSPEVERKIRLRPAMALKARVAFVKEVPPDTPVSYGCTYVTRTSATIATLPLGYADGWPRRLSGRGSVFIRGRRAPIVGIVCMDQCMVDVTGIPGVRSGDQALLFGGPELPLEEVAKCLDTISYEMLCLLSKRVPRVYVTD
ncbi:alanine racemase [Desulfocucumis palustris]|uniref:alanine racemase n=1 Tax=Desulfocucumis palustris TaxID=1898651 RepID=UPI000CEA0926|nr:alanine racemase [Desulfocucumis palustris]